ncbi:MAG: hypothetical protein OXU20_33305 [Myxococcales bacterium]|nr:hypothetical protein [Myxococcales bacterium]MDD9971037.1 hypothetical protein [Myxococcales bacterium]
MIRARAATLGVLITLSAGCATVAAPRARTPEPSPKSVVPSSLSVQMTEVARRLTAIGLVARRPRLEGFIPSGTRRSFPLDLPGGACVTLVALATAGVADMDAALYTPDGQLLAADSQPDSHPSIQVCGVGRLQRYYYVLHSYDGSGSFLVHAFAGPRDALQRAARELGGRPAVAVRPGPDATAEDEIQGLSQGLQKRGYTFEGEPIQLELSTAQRMRVALVVDAGHCYAVAAFGRDGLSDIDLRILDERGEEVAGDRAPLGHAQVQFCARSGAQYAAEAHAVAGAGPATLLVFHGAAHRIMGHAGLWQGQAEASKRTRRAPLSEAVAKVESEAAAAGYGRLITRLDGFLQFGEVAEREITLRGQRCYRLVATSDAGLYQLAFKLRRARLDQAGPSTPNPPQPAASAADLCVGGTETVRARLVAEQGSGSYALTVFAR